MGWDAYVFGELRWPMPDPGLVAVWRAMAIDATRWTDWDGFVDDDGVEVRDGGAGTIAALVDGGAPVDAAELIVDENGVKLRARVEDAHADWWQRLAIAWRLAADLDATGELVWVAGDGGPAAAYRAIVAGGGSRWERLTGASPIAGGAEVESLVKAALARHAPEKKAPKQRAATNRPVAAKKPEARTKKPAARAKPKRKR